MTANLYKKLDTTRLEKLLQERGQNYEIHHLNETHSTQDVAAELLRNRPGRSDERQGHDDERRGLDYERRGHDGTTDHILVLAETQTSGRGRLGRPWFSPAGSGIYMSLVLPPIVMQRYSPQLTIVTAAALCRVLRRMTELDIRMKWPNDLYVDDRKVSGILIESCSAASRNYFIMGAGISVNVKPDEYPPWLKDKATSLLAASGRTWDREEIIAEFVTELDVMVKLYASEGFSVFRAIWESYVWDPQQPIELNTPQGVVRGRQYAIDEDGALVVQLPDGDFMTIYSGDMSSDKSADMSDK